MIGFILPTGLNVVPDKNITKTAKPVVVSAKFGDGYEARARKGINSLDATYSITLSNRPIAEVNAIATYFDSIMGVTSFEFGLPADTISNYETVRVVCEDYNRTFEFNNYNTITATFRRVYDI
jgi:phage-related protein